MTTETRLQTLAERYHYAFEYHRNSAVAAIERWRESGYIQSSAGVMLHAQGAIYWHKRWYDEVRNADSRAG